MLGGTHSVALMIWVVTFGAGFLAGRDAFSRLLGRIRSVLLYPSIQYLGRWSYPLYLVHWPLLILGLCALLHAHPDLSGLHARLLMLVFALPLTIGISALLHYAIELPFMRMGRHLAHLRPVPPVHAPLRKVM
jgi:peptidoglycan/LPS O-acetylase OafA/YrhL